MSAKVCSKCGEEKPLLEFTSDRRYAMGVKADCKSCVAAYRRSIYDPEAARARKMKERYGLTLAEREAMGDACFVCTSTTEPHVDHNHFTGRVRGILCGPCNRVLGLVHEDPIRLAALIAYLEHDREMAA